MTESSSVHATRTSVELCQGTLIYVNTSYEGVSSEANHAGAVLRSVQIPAVSVRLAGAASLCALIDVSASNPGNMLSET